MLYTRGLRQDYDNWAKNGAKGWAYDDVLPYFMKSENNENADFVKSGKYQVWLATILNIFNPHKHQ